MLFTGVHAKGSVKKFDEYYGVNTLYAHNVVNEYKKDCEKIQQSFINHGILLTLVECREIYENYSDTYCSSWENGISDMEHNDLFKLLISYLKESLEDKVDRLKIVTDELSRNGYLR